MAEIKIKINTDATPIKDLLKNLDGVNSELKEINSSTSLENIANDADKADTATKSLKTQLREMTQELQGLEPGTQRFNDLTIAAGKLKDTIKDTNAVINATAGSGVENLSKGLAGIAGIGIAGFQGIASAQAIFGVESEKLQETLVKLQALAGLSDAVKSLGGLGDTITDIKASFNAFGADVLKAGVKLGILNVTKTSTIALTEAEIAANLASSTAKKAETVATEGATVATYSLNTAMLLNPVFLIVAGIAALTGAMIYFSEETETAEQFNDKLNETLEKQQGILDRQIEKTTRAADNRVSLLQAQGASEKEIFDAQQNLLRKEEDGRLQQLQQIEYANSKRLQSLNNALSKGEEETAKAIKKEYDANVQKFKDLSNLNGQYAKDKQILQVQFDTDQAADEKKAAEDLRKKQQDAYKKRLDDQEKYNADRLAASRRIKDLELAVLDEGQKKDELIQQEATKRELEDLNKKYGDRKKLSAVLLAEVQALEIGIKEQGNDKLLEIDKKYADKKLADDTKLAEDIRKNKELADALYYDTLDKIVEEQYQKSLTDQQRELVALDNKYANLIDLANGNAERIKEIEKLKAVDLKAIDDKATEDAIANQRKLTDQRLQLAQNGLAAVQAITELFANKGEKAAKKAFQVNKAAAIASAVISTYRGAASAFAETPGGPIIKGVAAGIAVAAGVANVAKIAATKFESASAPSASTPPSASLPSPTTPTSSPAAQPQFNLFGQGNQGNNVGPNGNEPSTSAIQVNSTVSVSEINAVQNKVAVQESRSTL